MSIKIDLEKAYDRLSWHCIRDCLRFPSNVVDLIMAFITSSSFKILWNGDKTESFEPARGTLQKKKSSLATEFGRYLV